MSDVLRAADALNGAPVGGKTRALALLTDAGFDVPVWFALSPDAFWSSVSDETRQRLNAAVERWARGGDRHAADEITALAASAQPTSSTVASLDAAFTTLCGADGRVAVRSSASDEDGAQHSFAGQLESVLQVSRDRLPAAVATVWHSGFSTRILDYRRQHGLSPLPPAPAVLIQKMVNARAAGVAFSADPVSGRRETAVVNATPGLGDGLVSGECDADVWHVGRGGDIVDRRIAVKYSASRAAMTGAGAVQRQVLDATAAAAPTLTDAEVREVALLARRVERHVGRPQDIEWAYEDDRLWLLQSRPITSIAALPDPDGELRLWDNSNIVESYSGVTTPMTFSFASEIYEHVYRQFCRIMRVPNRSVTAEDETFRNMLGLVRGRIYYNLLNWYRVLALLPGFAVNRRFMEQMMGVREGLPASIVQEIESRGSGARLADATHLAATTFGLIGQHLTLDRRVRAFTARLDAALAPPDPPLAARRPDELAAHYRDLRSRLLLSWDAPLVNDFFAMIFYGVLRSLSRRWCGDAEGTLQNDLVGGQGGLISAEPALRLTRMAALASPDGALVTALNTASASEIATVSASRPEFDREYRAYLERFGERSVNELKLETATLLDDPLPLLRAIGSLARQGVVAASTPAVAGPAFRARAQQQVADSLRGHPLRSLVFRWVLKHARRRVRDRENLRLERTRLFGRVRRIFLEIGRRLWALDVLGHPRDVFYLEVDEVLAFLDGRATTTALGELAALRKCEFAEYEHTAPPDDRFETRGPVYQGHSYRRTAQPIQDAGADADSRNGLGCCPGTVRGPVRVITDPRFADLERRAVLVAEHTDPGWITIFPSAIGVLVERGSLLSHAAIVARELGIPAIVSVPGVTTWLRDGDWVELDGSTGVVRRIPAPAGEDAAARDTEHAQ